MGFPYQNHLFRRKKLAFRSKAIFFLWITKEQSLWTLAVSFLNSLLLLLLMICCCFYLVFPRKMLVFRSKTIFIPGKVGFPIQTMFPRKTLVFHSKTKFFPAKSVHFICCLCVLRISVANKVRVSLRWAYESA